jgi:hypothetical protein
VRSAKEFDPAFAAITKEGAEAIIILPDALMMQHRALVIEFAMKQRIPAVSGWPAFARSGGIMTYGPNLREAFRALARSVDKVLKGANPTEFRLSSRRDSSLQKSTTGSFIASARCSRWNGYHLMRRAAHKNSESLQGCQPVAAGSLVALSICTLVGS